MTAKQRETIENLKKSNDVIEIDENFHREQIVYVHRGDSTTMEEYVIGREGEMFRTASHPFVNWHSTSLAVPRLRMTRRATCIGT
ncbi:MAG: hypothetical protein ACLQMF_13050 [Rectinemataceae bacterium]